MSAQLKALYELQTIDLQLAKLQRMRASLDDGSAKKALVESTRCDAQAAERLLQEGTTELHDKELNLKTVEGKQKTYREKLYAGKVTNAKELSSIEKEIEMLGRQKDKLEERILELMDIIEDRRSASAQQKEALKQEEDELAEILEKRRKDNSALVGRIKELLPKREQAVEAVDPVLLKRYDAARPRQGGVVVSKVENDDCSACHTQVGLGTLRELKADTGLITCDNCGRLLYLEM